MGDGTGTASICLAAFGRVALPAIRTIHANYRIALSDYQRFLLGANVFVTFQHVAIKEIDDSLQAWYLGNGEPPDAPKDRHRVLKMENLPPVLGDAGRYGIVLESGPR